MGETISTLTYLLPYLCNHCQGTGLYEPTNQSEVCKVCKGYRYVSVFIQGNTDTTPIYNIESFGSLPSLSK